MPLQRKVVDFGADVPFYNVPKKLLEHYGMELCPEIVRKVTLEHAERMKFLTFNTQDFPDKPGVAQIIAEADGGMIPIVAFDEGRMEKDKRKTRKVLWKEARLCFSRDVKKVKGIFRATLKSTDAMGDQWFSSAVAVGMGGATEVHCVGDGAIWIKNQADRVFGGRSTYLTDFYHVSEYLAAAGNDCSKEPKRWLKEQQNHLKEGRLYLVLQELEQHLYQEEEPPKESVEACYRYLTNRVNQLDYLGAPIQIRSATIEIAKWNENIL